MLLYFAVNLIPLSGGLTVSNVVSLPAVLNSGAAAFATLLAVPAATVYAVNVTDIATGAFASVGSVRRQLGGVAGSKGVAVTYVVRLGKTPQQSAVLAISATLASPTLCAGALTAVVSTLSSATTLPASAFSASVPAASVAIANAPFSTAIGVTAPADAGSSTSSAGGIVGGILGAIALACAVWGARSHRKHGQCPCCRDRKKEVLMRRNLDFEAAEVAKALAEAEAALEAEAASAAQAAPTPVFKPARPPGAKTAIVKRLVDANAAAAAREAKAAAEIAELKRALSSAKKSDDVDADEVAELRRQLAAARAAAKGEVEVANPAVAFAPRPVA